MAALVLVLQACGTTYVGHKLPSDGSQPAGDTGVPYNLTRHEFTLKIAPDSDDATKPVYTLQRTSVPDPNQRYSLALAPGFLTDGAMTYNFGAAGNLGNAEAATTSQVVATVKAGFGFITNVIGAKTALKDETDVWSIFLTTLKPPPQPCAGNEKQCDPKVIQRLMEQRKPCDEGGVGTGLAGYGDALDTAAKKKFPDPDSSATYKDDAARKKAAQAVKNQRSTWVANRFHYRSTVEQACLAAIQKVIANDESTDADKDYKEAAAALAKADGTAAKALRVLYANGDLNAVSSKLTSFDDKTNPDLKVAYQKAKAYLTSQQNNKLAAKLAQFYVDMPLDVWRARHLAQVETDLEAKRLALQLLLANAPKPDESGDVITARAAVKALETQRDQLVDATDLKLRIAAIDALLNAGNTGRADGRAQLSADRDRLQGLWDQARADLLAKDVSYDLVPKPKADKVKAKDSVPVVLVTQEYVDCVKAGALKADPKAPYVVVMQRIASPTPMQTASSPLATTLPAASPVCQLTPPKAAS